jgi:hypothetical protein
MIVLRGAGKAPVVGAFKLLEVIMKLITRFELATRSTDELRGLIRDLFNQLARSAPESTERRNALASLENVQAELAHRYALNPGGP